MRKHSGWRKVLPLFSLALFGGAAWLLVREFRRVSPQRILGELQQYSAARLAVCAAVTVFCYWTLTGYDLLGFRYVGKRIRYWHVTFAAFVAYAFANNIGMANFAGAAVRLRIYKAWNIATETIAEVVALDVLANWLGFFIVTGLCFTISPPALPSWLHLPFGNARPAGLVCLGLLSLYLVLAWRRKPIRIREVALPNPRNRCFLAQVGIACADFGLGGAALYVLLPSGTLSYWEFLCLYLLGQTAGIVSHVPGALGIFESVMLTCLAGRIESAQLLGALILYRVIYFVLPFIVASILLGIFELRTLWHGPSKTTAISSDSRQASAG